MLLAFGVLLFIAGGALVANVFGAADRLIRSVTSRSLGSLAPGYAATRKGLTAYAYLLGAVGLMLIGVGLAAWKPSAVLVVGLGVLEFVFWSFVAIRGEIRTYRALKR